MILLSYPKPMGTINIFRENANSDRTVIVNGNTAIDGQTITSSSEIETSLSGTNSGTNLTVTFDNAGRIKFGPDTKINLSLDENKILGVLSKGSVTVSVQPDTTLAIQTKDGFIKVLNHNQENIIVISFVGGKTQVRTLSGLATLNGTSIASGQYFIVGEPNVKNIDSTENSTPFAYIITPIRIVISAMLGDTNTSDSNIDSNQITVGPMR